MGAVGLGCGNLRATPALDHLKRIKGAGRALKLGGLLPSNTTHRTPPSGVATLGDPTATYLWVVPERASGRRLRAAQVAPHGLDPNIVDPHHNALA